MSTNIAIKLIDTTAKTDGADPASSDQFIWFGAIQVKISGGITRRFATLEQDFTLLDGTYQPFPDSLSYDDGNQYGWWTSSMSNENGNFATNPSISMQFIKSHTAQGLTLQFQEDYPLEIIIQWYSGTTLLISKTFNPNVLDFFCEQAVVEFTKIVITVTKTKPYRRVKLSNIEYGRIMQWSGNDVVSSKVLEEVNPVSNELSINTAEFELYDADGNFDILNPKGLFTYLQKGQEVEISNDDNGCNCPFGTFFLDTWESEDNDTGKFTTYDSVGKLDKFGFYGNLYSNVEAQTLIGQIMSAAGIKKYSISTELQSLKLSGYIPICKCREALQQIAFALHAVVSDARSDTIKIYRTLRSYSQILGRDRKFEGGKTSLLSLVSTVKVLAHNYSLNFNLVEVFRGNVAPGISLIKLQDPATGIVSETSGISVIFPPESDPAIDTLSVNNVWVRSTLDTPAELVLQGSKYVDNMVVYTASNSDLSGDTITVDKATLITADNAQEVANSLLAYYNLRFQTEIDFPLEQEQAGDKIAIENKSGVGYTLNTAESFSIDLTGGVVATAKLLSDGKDLIMTNYCGDMYCGEVMGVM